MRRQFTHPNLFFLRVRSIIMKSQINYKAEWAADPEAHLRADTCSLCGQPKYNPCSCGMRKTVAGEEGHEIDLFHYVVGLVDALIVSLDPSLVAIRRVWCVAEIGKALMAGTVYFRLAEGLAAELAAKLWDGIDLLETVEKCDATSPADRDAILKEIRALDGGVKAYDSFVNRVLELSLGSARKFHEIQGIGLEAIRRMQTLEMDITWAADKVESLQELMPNEEMFGTLVQLTSLKIDCGGLKRLADINSLRLVRRASRGSRFCGSSKECNVKVCSETLSSVISERHYHLQCCHQCL